MFFNIYSSQISVFVHIDMIMYSILVIKIIMNFYFWFIHNTDSSLSI